MGKKNRNKAPQIPIEMQTQVISPQKAQALMMNIKSKYARTTGESTQRNADAFSDSMIECGNLVGSMLNQTAQKEQLLKDMTEKFNKLGGQAALDLKMKIAKPKPATEPIENPDQEPENPIAEPTEETTEKQVAPEITA